MVKNKTIELLYDKDPNKAYKALQELEKLTEQSNEYYCYFDTFLAMLTNEHTFMRMRGVRMICALSKWDVDNKINPALELILTIFDDEKPSVVRQACQAFEILVTNKKELRQRIKDKLDKVQPLKYKESMQGLIKKDINHLQLMIEYLEEQ
ncbi:hypothetical protein [Anaerorhabdus sp.]|uniref:hypothetical protein n=1 Tax=Anaerorhabdus sp. TaxID=1872524 RepID=UPI002FCB1BA6